MKSSFSRLSLLARLIKNFWKKGHRTKPDRIEVVNPFSWFILHRSSFILAVHAKINQEHRTERAAGRVARFHCVGSAVSSDSERVGRTQSVQESPALACALC